MRPIVALLTGAIMLLGVSTACATDISPPTRPIPPTLPSGQIKPLPYTPNVIINGPGLSGPVYAGVRTSLSLRLQNVKPGTQVKVTPVAVTGGCSFLTATPAQPVTATVSASKEATVTIPGQFSFPSPGQTGPCTAKFKVDSVKLDGTATSSTPTFSSITLAAPTVYVLTSTTAWVDRFAFSNTSASGDCTGMSNGPSGIFLVGLRTSEGSQNLADLTFKVRSGPFGTRCVWKSQPILLPEGVRLTQIETGIDQSSKCTVNPATSPNGGFTSVANPVTAGGITVGTNPLGSGLMASGISELRVVLNCSNTAINDHYGTLTIKSLTFEGPPGLTDFP